MSSESTTKRQFSYPEEDTYSQVDSLAVVALVCGLVSFLTLIFSPIFVVPGIVGVIFGIVSLARIKQSEGTLSGFWLASIGAACALFVATSYFTYASARKAQICASAQKHAEDWINMVQTGKIREAHQLTRSYFERQLPGTNLEAHYSPDYKNPDAGPRNRPTAVNMEDIPFTQMNEFYSRPVLNVLKEKGLDCKVEFVRVLDQWSVPPFVDYVALEFEIKFQENGQPRNNFMAVTMMREKYPAKQFGVQWAVDLVDGKKGATLNRPGEG